MGTTYVPTSLEIPGNEGWRMFAAGFDNLSYAELLEDIWTQGFTESDGGVGASSNVYTWNGASYVPISDGSVVPDPGTGFIVYVYSDDNVLDGTDDGFPKSLILQGTERTGTVSPSLYYLDSGSTNDTDSLGWNLLGNPFLSTIDWDASSGWTSSNLDNTIYVWSDTANSNTGAWLNWNGITGTKPDGFIAAGQGFYVKANAASPSLSIGEEVKKDTSTVLFKKPAVPEVVFTLHGNSISAKSIVVFIEAASTGYDAYDAYQLAPLSGEWLSISTAPPNNNSKFSVNALPSILEEDIEIPMYIDGTSLNGEFSLSWNTATLPDGYEITLQDHETGESIPLNATDGYEFTLDEEVQEVVAKQSIAHKLMPKLLAKTETTPRFSLIISQTHVVSNEVADDLPTRVALHQNYPNPFNPSTTIGYEVPRQSRVQLEVFNLLGQKVITLVDETKVQGRYTARFDASNLSSGIYIYRLQVGKTLINKKMTLIK